MSAQIGQKIGSFAAHGPRLQWMRVEEATGRQPRRSTTELRLLWPSFVSGVPVLGVREFEQRPLAARLPPSRVPPMARRPVPQRSGRAAPTGSWG